jgi:dinuclear metal center YbgI/SA1388 family protein
MPVARVDLIRHLDALLDPRLCRDYGPNGLQVEGRTQVRHLATATTASLATCRAAVDAGADALLVHHGLFWGKEQRITGILRERLAVLLAGGMNLIAYHLPLDAHPEVGNNAVLAGLLGATPAARFAHHHGLDIGLIADLPEAVPAADLAERLTRALAHGVVHCPGADRPIRRIGIVTGGGQHHLLDAAAAGCDAFITGETGEQSWHEAAETGCHLFACGHHATECIAVHRLGERLAAQFHCQWTRIDLPNPL